MTAIAADPPTTMRRPHLRALRHSLVLAKRNLIGVTRNPRRSWT